MAANTDCVAYDPELNKLVVYQAFFDAMGTHIGGMPAAAQTPCHGSTYRLRYQPAKVKKGRWKSES
jgi:hypothetical protein